MTAPVHGREDALRALSAATAPTDLFGPLPADGRTVPPEATARYRRLALLLHPDTARGDGRGAEAFLRLAELWARYRAAATGRAGVAEQTLVTRERTYRTSGEPPLSGHVADLHPAHHERNGVRHEVLLKVPRSPRDNDLMEAEAASLRRIREHGPERARAFFPELVESFRHRDPGTGTERRVNVLDRLEGFRGLDEVRRAFPGGIDPRDAAWMWRRLLVALGAAAAAGVVHGAVVPEHVLIHPEKHGLVLVGWCCSVAAGAPGSTPHIPATVPGREEFYPPEVAARRPARPETDIFMATRCIEHVTAGRLPRALRAFARGCTLPAPERRPSDGFAVLGELDEALERLYGPRRFRPFHMPSPVRPPKPRT
ncbi:molecular chaperone DnaJ [Nocardiopsis algeriensis]|uniref:Protein kinase domain-containing protein n=1 Tax=Nocardiopsis algeriensis TaxID=1478215 RepID=A0A841ITJ4_9ACTN|nr:hypothetical protein [Nocardiopsis algeriensis]